jgi:hypothetical protein
MDHWKETDPARRKEKLDIQHFFAGPLTIPMLALNKITHPMTEISGMSLIFSTPIDLIYQCEASCSF